MALSFGGVAMAFALGAGLYMGQRQAEELREQTGSALRQFAFLAGADIARSIDERHDDLMFAASLRSFRGATSDEASRERQREHFTDLQRWHPEFVWMGFADTSGSVRSSSGRMLEEADVSEREWFRRGMVRSHFGDVHDASLLRALIPQAKGQSARLIDISTPVAGPDGNVRGVIGAHLGDSWLRSRLMTMKRGVPALQSVEILLLARDGSMVASSDGAAGERGDLVKGAWVGADAAGGHTLAAMEGGREYLAGYHRVAPHGDFPGFGWTVLARQEAAVALAPATRAREASFAILALLGAIFAALGWYIAGRIGAPLEEITRAAARLGSGTDVALPSSDRRDEIGSLATALRGLVSGLKEDEALIRAREAELENIVETMVEGVAIYDATGRITRVNAAAERILGAHRAEIVGRHFSDVPWRRLLANDARLPDDAHPFARLKAGEERMEGVEFDILTAQGRRTTIQLSAAPIRDAAGAFAGMVATYADISERKQAEERARRTQERLDRALEASKIALFEVDVRSGLVYLSETWSLMRGGPAVATQTTVARLLDLTHPEDRDRLWSLAKGAIGTYGLYEAEHRVRDATGEWLWIISRARVVERDAEGRALRLAGTNVDVTERKRAEQRIHYLNTRDALTDLSNRAVFADRLEQAMDAAGRNSRGLALLAIGLDRFTAINESLGRDFGDEVLKGAAGRIMASIGVDDVVARPGGDEYLVLLERADSPDEARRAAEAMRAAVSSPMHLLGREAVVTMSVGIAMYPGDGDSAGVLLRNAGTALTSAKAAGGDGVHFFAPQMNVAARARFETEAELRRGLERDEFVLHFQPQVDLASGSIVGWEALVRWMHPERGLLPPGHFLPIAEASGLIVPLGEQVLLKACRQSISWKQAGLASARIAINVSAQQFRHPGFMKSVRAAFASTGLDPRQLELEIVENALIGQEPVIDAVFEQLGAAGVELAIDDFGTGYSSLSYLKRLPIDTVKIDQSFVRDVPASPEACAIVHAVIAMAHGLGLKVIAEGIEHPAQLDFLRQGGCDRGQGYLFGRPEPPEHWSRTSGNVLPLKRSEARGTGQD